MEATVSTCPLCAAEDRARLVDAVAYRDCGVCGMLAMHPDNLPTRDVQREQYELHENDPGDPRYRAFLDRLARPLIQRLQPGQRGLDYGCGPGPALVAMLSERGFPTVGYDPFFSPDPRPLQQTWDFITCTETVEHFHHPRQEFDRLARMLNPGGILAIMTRVLADDVDFATWFYRRDPTHVAFYRPQTLQWIADRHGWQLQRPHPDVAIYSSPG
jgi:SAM-dependent methyltransferase